MENSNSYSAGKLQKCPYQILLYGEDNCDLAYRKAYKGDWGDWDDLPESKEKAHTLREDSKFGNHKL
jgi:hypothetical protein